MIIKKLYISSFGKFKNKEIDLSAKMNVIYGLNEAGKSTIHKFIEGMLFGFFRPGVKSRLMTEDHTKYSPRNTPEYFGSMVIEHQKEVYVLYRDFNKSKPKVTLTNQRTGQDITDNLEVHSATKLPDIPSFFGLDYTIYRNTVSFSQTKQKDEEKNLSEIVVESLTNLHTTKDEEISLVRINDSIEKELEEIGTTRAKTKPLLQTKEKVDALEQEKRISEQKYQEINGISKELNELYSKKNQLILIRKESELVLSRYENETKKELFNKAKAIDDESKTYYDLSETLSSYAQVDSQSDVEVRGLLKALQESKDNELIISQDIKTFKTTQEELYPRLNSLHISLLKSYVEAEIDEKQKNQSSPMVVFLLSLLTLSIYFFVHRKKRKLIKHQIQKLREDQKLYDSTNIEIGQYHEDILKRHAERIYEDVIIQSSSYKEIQVMYNNFIEITNEVKLFDSRITEKEQSLKLVQGKILQLQQDITDKLNSNQAENLEQLTENISFKKQYDDALRKTTEAKTRIQDLLGTKSLSELAKEIDFTIEINFDESELHVIKERIRRLFNEELDLQIQVHKLESEISFIERNHREVDIIENEYRSMIEKYEKLATRQKALTKVQSVLEKLSDEISYEFAPILNKEISSVIHQITNKKYNDIKVDRKLNVKVFDKEAKKDENITFFSKGTIDQLYLSLRIGINNILSKETYPFVFDDTFVNYDDDRLKQVLDILVEEASKRQIILLSCHHREMELLGKKANAIEL